jgi:hypothetical protein
VYKTLGRLERDGLAESDDTGQDGPQKRFRITAEGRDASARVPAPSPAWKPAKNSATPPASAHAATTRTSTNAVGQLARNGSSSARNWLGCSRCGIWPQSGITTRLARGMSRAAAAESAVKSPSRAASAGCAYWPSGTV